MSKKKAKQRDLGEQIREAIADSGMSRFKLAKRSGVPYSGVHRFVGGQRGLTLDTASKLCEVLGLELRSIMQLRK